MSVKHSFILIIHIIYIYISVFLEVKSVSQSYKKRRSCDMDITQTVLKNITFYFISFEWC